MSLQGSCALSILIQVLLCRDFEDVIKIISQLTLTLGDYPGVPGSVQCCHLRPQEYKWEVEESIRQGVAERDAGQNQQMRSQIPSMRNYTVHEQF